MVVFRHVPRCSRFRRPQRQDQYSDGQICLVPVSIQHCSKTYCYLRLTDRSLTNVTDEAEYLLPFYLNSQGGAEGFNKTQCLCAGANNWLPTQKIFQAGIENGGAPDQWAVVDTPQAWGYFKREDIPYHFALAESYSLADHYHVFTIVKYCAVQVANMI